MQDPPADESLLDIADRSLQSVFLVDATGRIQYVNRHCAATLGYAASDLTGTRILDLVAPDDRERTLREARQVLAGNRREGFENRYQHRSGANVHFRWSARWLETNQLRLGIARDVTASRKTPGSFLLPQAVVAALAAPECEVLFQLLTSASERQIATRTGMTLAEVRTHVGSIYRRLGVSGRLGLFSLCLGSSEWMGSGSR
ncbi:PAS domain S-box protein [Cupriavidus agavae]|uniref:PAS domain S-box-containing protein n=1 Tax=Cupriavidus agavae TaxID=1001822 RepID=A0A4Q7RYY2_9BURK|nr:PAS domain S-box protein [Cupriavidus agavae]RZT39084.1 PAS domain S-box-containing protein [Cupriavidus agavae]